jgi:hypothetical protein
MTISFIRPTGLDVSHKASYTHYLLLDDLAQPDLGQHELLIEQAALDGSLVLQKAGDTLILKGGSAMSGKAGAPDPGRSTGAPPKA